MELGVAGIDAGDEPCGCRSTGVVETVAREHGEGHAMALRVPGVAVKLMATVVWPLDGRSLVGDELVRRRVRVSFVRWLQSERERERRGWEGGHAHGGCDGAGGEVGGELLQWRRRRGSPTVSGEGEVGGGASGQPS